MARKKSQPCASLPEAPWSYFSRPPGTDLVPLADLQPTRARPKGIANARVHMAAACKGGPKRDPITVLPDGRVYDGNSTFAVAKVSRWKTIPTQQAIWTKVSSHRARRQVAERLGRIPQGYYTMRRRVPAATSYYWLSPKEFQAIEGIKGVSRARYKESDEWQPTIRMNPEGKYFDAAAAQMMHFEYVEHHKGDGGREAYRLTDGTWLSGVRRDRYGNLLKRKNTKRPPRWISASTTVPNPPSEITRDDYPAIFDDTDRDSIVDVDDPHPFDPGDTQSIEEVRLSDEIGKLIDTRQSYVPVTESVMQSLRDLKIPGSEIKGRVKTPFSIVNKLRRKRLGTLTDIAATMIVVPDMPSLKAASASVEEDFEVIDKDDYYKTPQAGYRALHYIVKSGGVPVEIQIKTRRMKEIGDASHTPYKNGVLDIEAMDRLTSLAARADAGDAKAQREIDPLLRDKAALRRTLTRTTNPRAATLARRLSNP